MPEQDKSELFAAWLEQNLSDQQRREFEHLCVEDAEFAAQVAAATQITMRVQSYDSEPPPDWDRESTFTLRRSAKWWQWQPLPAISMACSIVAIVMVISGFQLSVSDAGVIVSFQSGVEEKQIEQKLDQRLIEFQQQQQQTLANYAQSLQQQQLDASTQLTNYLLASSRQERREDFGELIKFINEQRQDDQIFYARQLNQLQQELYSEPTTAPWSSASGIDQINQ